MKTSDYWRLIGDLGDPEPSVVVVLTHGGTIRGVARAPGYGGAGTKRIAWITSILSDPPVDVAVDIRTIATIYRPKS